MKEVIDLSGLRKQDKEVIEKFIELMKENTMLKSIIKDLTKLIKW